MVKPSLVTTTSDTIALHPNHGDSSTVDLELLLGDLLIVLAAALAGAIGGLGASRKALVGGAIGGAAALAGLNLLALEPSIARLALALTLLGAGVLTGANAGLVSRWVAIGLAIGAATYAHAHDSGPHPWPAVVLLSLFASSGFASAWITTTRLSLARTIRLGAAPMCAVASAALML